MRGETRLDGITPPGVQESDEAEIATADKNFYAVWFEQDPTTNRDIYYSRSLDGGKTWSTAVRLDQDPGIGDQDQPVILAQDNVVVVAWLDDRAQAGIDDVRGRVSTDFGATFAAEINLSGSLFNDVGDADNLEGAIALPYVYFSFEDDLAAKTANPAFTNEDCYVVSSQSGGLGFGNPMRVNTPPGGAGDGDVDSPVLGATGSYVYAAWADHRNSLADHVFLNRSSNGGVTWQTSDVQLDPGNPAAQDTNDAQIAVAGSNVYVMWRDARNQANFFYQVFMNASLDHGASWLGDVRVDSASSTTGDTDAKRGRIAAEANRFYLVWPDDRNGGGNAIYDVFYRPGAVIGGSLVFGAEQRMDVGSAPGAANDGLPRIAARGDYVYVAYQDTRNDPNNVNDTLFLRVSSNLGVSFGPELALAPGLAGTQDAEELGFAVSDYRDVVCIWGDNRNGTGMIPPNDIFVNGQRFPNFTVSRSGGTLTCTVTEAGVSDQSFIVLLSGSGTDLTRLYFTPNRLPICLTIDTITLQFLRPIVMGGISNGSGTLSMDIGSSSGLYGVGLVFQPGSGGTLAKARYVHPGSIYAASDPVAIP